MNTQKSIIVCILPVSTSSGTLDTATLSSSFSDQSCDNIQLTSIGVCVCVCVGGGGGGGQTCTVTCVPLSRTYDYWYTGRSDHLQQATSQHSASNSCSIKVSGNVCNHFKHCGEQHI